MTARSLYWCPNDLKEAEKEISGGTCGNLLLFAFFPSLSVHTAEERQTSSGEGSESSSPKPDSSKEKAAMQTCAARFPAPQSPVCACDLENPFRSEVVKFSHANLYELHQARRGFGFRMIRAPRSCRSASRAHVWRSKSKRRPLGHESMSVEPSFGAKAIMLIRALLGSRQRPRDGEMSRIAPGVMSRRCPQA